MSKPIGIVDYVAPWFIPLFCFIAGYFLNTVIENRINHENYHEYLSGVRANPSQD